MRHLTYGPIGLWTITGRESITVASWQLNQKWVGRLLVLLIAEQRGTGPVGLPCSRNARSRTPFVGRVQWEINQRPHP
ncbi:MAG: hypothetical protein JJE16_12845 [Nitrospiraceae bacterium]|nr:hypothetical protein [Nitrospiraceae bacterium]